MKNHKGTVVSFTSNKHHDIDGLIVKVRGKKMTLRFPPHTATRIMKTIHENDPIEFFSQEEGNGHKDPRHELWFIRHQQGDTFFEVGSIAPPHPVDSERIFTMTIDTPELTKDDKGEITGIISGDKYIHLAPKEVKSFKPQLIKAKQVMVKATKRKEKAGFVHARGLKVYQAVSVQIGEDVYEL